MVTKRQFGRFPSRPQGKYDTPAKAAAPLLPHLKPGTRFIEPCVGEGFLVGHLKRAGHICVGAFDLPTDACTARYDVDGVDAFITNPNWDVKVMHPLIANLSDQRPTWILLYSDWLLTQQARPLFPRMRDVAVVGRVQWIEDSKNTGFDNCCWVLFDRPRAQAHATLRLFGRANFTRTPSAGRAA